jgi:V-type H+-transporting ATPase subunit F
MALQKDRILMAIIGDEVRINTIHTKDSVTGMLLAGIGHVDTKQHSNFLVVDGSKHMKFLIQKHRWPK